LEELLLDEAQAAHRFVVEELGELADDTERARRIRETLLASLSTGSQARAAAELGVHENTVRLRIRSATEKLGDDLANRRTELLVALRLRHALGAPGKPEVTAVPAAG
jgi:DNA-binding PucR family transcriptional regulator